MNRHRWNRPRHSSHPANPRHRLIHLAIRKRHCWHLRRRRRHSRTRWSCRCCRSRCRWKTLQNLRRRHFLHCRFPNRCRNPGPTRFPTLDLSLSRTLSPVRHPSLRPRSRRVPRHGLMRRPPKRAVVAQRSPRVRCFHLARAPWRHAFQSLRLPEALQPPEWRVDCLRNSRAPAAGCNRSASGHPPWNLVGGRCDGRRVGRETRDPRGDRSKTFGERLLACL